jgi:hypothetical protein
MNYEALQREVAQLLATHGTDAVLGAIAVQLESDPETTHLAEQIDEIRLVQPRSIQHALVTAA